MCYRDGLRIHHDPDQDKALTEDESLLLVGKML